MMATGKLVNLAGRRRLDTISRLGIVLSAALSRTSARPHPTEAPMTTMLRVAIACSTTLLLAGCGKSEQAAKDSAAAAAAAAAAATPAPPPPPAPFSLTDAAG